MKKIKKDNIFKKILRFFDRKVIVPITKLVLLITNKINAISKSLEKVLKRQNVLIFISLIFALITYFVIDHRSSDLIQNSAEVLYNQPVKAVYNEEAYVIEGLPKTVDITLIGRKSDIYLAQQMPTHEVTVNLSDLKPGTHKVDLKYRKVVSSIDYKLDPSVVTVIVYPKVSKTKSLTVDLLNKDKLDPKLIITNTKIDTDEVVIKGAEHQLKSVATVKALVDIDDLSTREVGDIQLKDIPLIAYDQRGKAVDVEIVPKKVDATLTIASPTKEVPIKVVPKGKVSFGKGISSIKMSQTKVNVYGTEEDLAKINYVPVEIDVDGLKADKEYNVSLSKPVGVNYMDVNNLVVNVTLDKETTKEIDNVNINYENLASGLEVQAASKDDTQITVIARGVEGVLGAIDKTNVHAYVDLKGLGAGVHEVEVKVEGDDLKATYAPKTKKITLNIKAVG